MLADEGLRTVFRVDASTRIGTGHVMRCLTLAHELRRRGAICTFVCRDHPANLVSQLRDQGFAVRPLSRGDAQRQSGYGAWLGADWETDARQTLAALGSERPDWLVVDHYALDARWERSVHAACDRLMAIDDLANRPHHCELLLDQNLGRKAGDYAGRLPLGCELLVGPRYALVRPEFAGLREASAARRKAAGLARILVSLGGVDGDNVTSDVLQALMIAPLPSDVTIDVVMGGHAPWLAAVQHLAARMAIPTNVHVDTKDMAGLMSDADLAVGAAGSTSWERCVVGLPAIVVVLAANQIEAADALARSGAVSVLAMGARFAEALSEAIRALQQASRLRAMAERALAVCDGRGTALVASRMSNARGRPA